MKGASAEVNNTNDGLIIGVNDVEVPAEVIEVPMHKKRIYITGKIPGDEMGADPASHNINEQTEVPIEYVINNNKQLLNITPTYATPATTGWNVVEARVSEIPDKSFELKKFLNGFTEPSPWYPELYERPPQGHILSSEQILPQDPPTIIGQPIDKPAIGDQNLSTNISNGELPTTGANIANVPSPAARIDIFDQSNAHGSIDNMAASTNSLSYLLDENKLFNKLPPFPSYGNTYGQQMHAQTHTPGLNVMPVYNNINRPPVDMMNRNPFPNYTKYPVTSETVAPYRPGFPFYRPSTIIYNRPTANLPPTTNSLPMFNPSRAINALPPYGNEPLYTRPPSSPYRPYPLSYRPSSPKSPYRPLPSSYRPSLPLYYPSQVNPSIVYPQNIYSPHSKISPVSYSNIIQCRPRFPIYQGSSWFDGRLRLPNINVQPSYIPRPIINSPVLPPPMLLSPSIPASNVATPMSLSTYQKTGPITGHLITTQPSNQPQLITSEYLGGHYITTAPTALMQQSNKSINTSDVILSTPSLAIQKNDTNNSTANELKSIPARMIVGNITNREMN